MFETKEEPRTRTWIAALATAVAALLVGLVIWRRKAARPEPAVPPPEAAPLRFRPVRTMR